MNINHIKTGNSSLKKLINENLTSDEASVLSAFFNAFAEKNFLKYTMKILIFIKISMEDVLINIKKNLQKHYIILS